MTQHGAVGGGCSRLTRGDPRVVDEEEHDHVPEERDRVEQEEDGERLGARDVGDEAADDPADADAEVHRQPLLGEGGVTPCGRREPRDERRLARPEPRRAGALDRDQHECLPWSRARAASSRIRPPAGSRPQPRVSRGPKRSITGPARTPGGELRQRGDSDHEACRPEAEAADVMQVDHEEREDDPVPEGVQHAPDLQKPDIARQVRVRAAG